MGDIYELEFLGAPHSQDMRKISEICKVKTDFHQLRLRKKFKKKLHFTTRRKSLI